ncbi:MAG: reverse transcriptase-like protein [Lachnospiraceae bacterium]|nr:reverse transcriptase-like protein [Lachnospiraceae bacterium]
MQQPLIAYVDGSFQESIGTYAFGCVFIQPEGVISVAFGNGNNPESAKQRNVTGEMLGAMYAVQCARKSGYSAIEIYFDYSGIECWVTGAWKSKNDLTKKYAASMREWGQSIRITFHKVPAHSHVEYNELADKLAKRGLTEGNGIPPIRRIDEMELFDGV